MTSVPLLVITWPGIGFQIVISLHYLGLFATKTVFGVSDKVRFKPAFSATGLARKLKFRLPQALIWYFPKSDNKGADQTGLHLCCSQTPEDRFSHVEAHFYIIQYFLWTPNRVIKGLPYTEQFLYNAMFGVHKNWPIIRAPCYKGAILQKE